MFQRVIYLNCIIKIKIVISNVALKIRFMIIIEKFSSKIMFITIKRDFLKKNYMTLIKQCLFELVTKKLFVFKKLKNVNDRSIIFIKVKNINNCLICVLLCNSNKFNMIFFINVIFENVKDKIYKFKMKFRIYIIRASIKTRVSICGKIIIYKYKNKLQIDKVITFYEIYFFFSFK